MVPFVLVRANGAPTPSPFQGRPFVLSVLMRNLPQVDTLCYAVARAVLIQEKVQAGGILLCVLRFGNAFVLRSTLPHIIVIPRVLSAGVEKKLTPRL